jgi:hypothetical protein
VSPDKARFIRFAKAGEIIAKVGKASQNAQKARGKHARKIVKNLGENDLVYELTEIDTWPEVCSATPPLASAKSAKSNRASAVFSLLIVGTSQSRAVPSADAVSTRWPSALNCAEVTPSSCFIGSPIALPVTASQSRAV